MYLPALPLQPSANREPAGHTFGDRSIEVRIVQSAQERDEIALFPEAHVQLAHQRIDLIRTNLGVAAASSSTGSSATAIASISTRAAFGSAATWTVERAGGWALKYFA